MIETIAISFAALCLLLAGYCVWRTNAAIRKACEYRRDRDDAWREKDRHGKEVREQTKKEMEGEVKRRLTALKAAFEVDNTHLVSQALVGESARGLQDLIKNTVDQRYKRMSQELLGGISEDAEGLARDLQFELCEKIWDAFQWYKEKTKDTPTVLPDNCKLAYTKGCRTVIVIEQKPQVRSVTFTGELVKSHSVAEHAQARTDHGYRFTLAFPFVYFVIVFDNGKYAYHELYFRNKPLTSSREYIYLAPIPNVFRGDDNRQKHMCMGGGFKKDVDGELTIARQCEVVVSEFWQRTFNADLGTGGHENIDKRIKNYATWQKHSVEDSLFILTVNWKQGKTIKGVIEAALDQRKQGSVDGVDAHIRGLLTTGVTNLTEKLKVAIQQAKTHNLSPIQLEQDARAMLEATVTGHSRNVFEKCSARV